MKRHPITDMRSYLLLFLSALFPLLCQGQDLSATDSLEMQAIFDSIRSMNETGADPVLAISMAERLSQKAMRKDAVPFRIKAEVETADAYFIMRQLDSAQVHAELANALATTIQSPNLQISALGMLANIASAEGDYANALRMYEEVLDLAEEKGTPLLVAQIKGNMSGVLDRMGDYTRSLQMALEAQEYFEANGMQGNSAVSYNNIGERYRQNFNDDIKAMEYYAKAAAINQSIGNWRDLAMNYRNMSLVQMNQKKYDSAYRLLKKSEELLSSNRDLSGMAHLYHAFGSLNLHREAYGEARSYFQKVKELCERNGVLVGAFHAHIGLGAVADSVGQHAQAHGHFDTARVLSQQMQSGEMAATALLNLYSNAKRMDDPALALDYYEQYRNIKDTLDAELSKRQVASIKIGYETTIKEKENEALLADAKVKEALIENQRRVQIAAIGLIILLLVLIVQLYRTSKIRKNAYRQVNSQKEELERKNQALAEIDQQKNTIFSVVAHDLRGPVANVKGVLDIIEMGAFSEEEQQSVTRGLKQDVKHTLYTMENLLVWAKSQMAGIPPRPKVFRMASVAEECISLLGGTATAKDIRLKVEQADAVSVFADEEQVRSVFRNLVSNAVKFSPKGSTVSIVIDRSDAKAIVKVIDQGLGMDESILAKINDPNITYSTRGTGGEPGTGIGLQVVKEFVKRNGGSFEISSEKGKGTVAMFSLPLAER